MERKGICKNVATCSLAKEKSIQDMSGLPGMYRCSECGKFLKELDQKRLKGPDAGKINARMAVAIVIVVVMKGTPGANKITLNLAYGIYIGKVKNGKPEGKGKMIYKIRTAISEDDRQQRYAEAGQSVDGIWYEGRLDTGELIDRNGNKISSLNIGRRP